MATVADPITGALQELGVIAAGEVPTAGDFALGLARLNDWLDEQKSNGIFAYSYLRSTWTITSGTGTYTVGSGGTVNIDRPTSPEAIQQVRFQDTSLNPVLEMPLDPLTRDAYAAVAQKTLTNTYPSSWYYDAAYPLGTLILIYTPTSTTLQGVIYAAAQVAEFTSTGQSLALPPGYRRMFRTNLAVEMAASYPGSQVTPTLLAAARESLAAVQRANVRMSDMGFEAGALISGRGKSAWSALVGP